MTRLKAYQPVLVLVLSGIFLCCYAFYIPGAAGAALAVELPVFETVPGDIPGYLVRFAASALFLGILPVFSLFLIRWISSRGGRDESQGEEAAEPSPISRPAGLSKAVSGAVAVGPDDVFSLSLGLGRPQGRPFHWWPFWALLAFCITFGALGSLDPGLFSFYPYSKTLALGLAGTDAASSFSPGWAGFVLHALLYVVFYYLPWEIFFRGFLILPFLSFFSHNEQSLSSIKSDRFPGLLFVASIQVIPSSLLHFGHPLSESLGAVFFGLLAAYLVLRFRSIWPPLILHAATGLSLDLAIRIWGVV